MIWSGEEAKKGEEIIRVGEKRVEEKCALVSDWITS